jgi:hypothetical protein
VRIEPYVAIIGGVSDGYVVVCQSEYVGLKKKIMAQDASGGWRLKNMCAPEKAHECDP